MGSKGTSFSWCGVIEAAVLKGCVPLLLLRHKVMHPIPVINPGSPHGALHSNERGQCVFYFFSFRCCPFDPLWSLSSVQWSTFGQLTALKWSPFHLFWNFFFLFDQMNKKQENYTALQVHHPISMPFPFLVNLTLFPHYNNSKYLKVKGTKR